MLLNLLNSGDKFNKSYDANKIKAGYNKKEAVNPIIKQLSLLQAYQSTWANNQDYLLFDNTCYEKNINIKQPLFKFLILYTPY
jgi:hypothetical protein